MSDHNRSEALRDRLAQRLMEHKAAVYKAFGVGQRPYGTVKLSGAEKIDYWKSLSIEQKAQKWQQMTPEEQQAFKQEMGGVY